MALSEEQKKEAIKKLMDYKKQKEATSAVENFNNPKPLNDVQKKLLEIRQRKVTPEVVPQQLNKVQQFQEALNKPLFGKTDVLGGAAKTFFGGTAKAVGTAAQAGIEDVKSLVKGQPFNPQSQANVEAQKAYGTPAKAAGTILSSAIETTPVVKVPFLGKMTGKLGNVLKTAAESQYARALAPTTKEAKILTQRVVPELLKKRVVGGMEKIGDIAREGVEKYGGQIEEAVENIPQAAKVAIKPVVDTIDNFKNQFIVAGKIISKKGVKVADDLKNVIEQFGEEIGQRDLIGVRRIIDKEVQAGKGFLGVKNTLGVEARKEMVDSIRTTLAEANPKLAEINKKFSFWKNVEKVVTGTSQRKVGQSGGLRKTVAEVSGAVVGSPLGVAGSFITGKAAGLLEKGLSSPAWNTVSAVAKNELAKAISENSVKKVTTIMAKVLNVGKNLTRD